MNAELIVPRATLRCHLAEWGSSVGGTGYVVARHFPSLVLALVLCCHVLPIARSMHGIVRGRIDGLLALHVRIAKVERAALGIAWLSMLSSVVGFHTSTNCYFELAAEWALGETTRGGPTTRAPGDGRARASCGRGGDAPAHGGSR